MARSHLWELWGKTFSRSLKVLVNDTSWRCYDSTSVRPLGPDFDNRVAQFVTYGLQTWTLRNMKVLLNIKLSPSYHILHCTATRKAAVRRFRNTPSILFSSDRFLSKKKNLLWRTFRFRTQCPWTVAVGNTGKHERHHRGGISFLPGGQWPRLRSIKARTLSWW